jgi:hypothetical protein
VNKNIDNTKLAGVLNSLDKNGQLAGKKFLESPYFNSSKELITLFLECNKLIDKNKPLDKQVLWKKVGGNKPYNDLRFRKYCSDLSKLMEQFLAQQAFDQDDIQQKIFLLKSLHQQEQRAEKLAKSTIKTASEMMTNHPYRDTDYYLNQYQIQKNFYELQDFETKRGVKSNIEEISEHLDFFYIGEKLRLITEAESRTQLKAHDYNIALKEEVLGLINVHINRLGESPQIKIYYQIYKMLSEEDADTYYYHLKELIEKYAHFFPRDVAVEELYGAAQNYCVKKVNAGNPSFLNELFELFKLLINQNFIISDGKINPWYFKNIVFVGLRLGKYDWTEAFILKYQEYLPDALKANAVTYNLANLYFYQKRYNEVIQQLQYVEYDDLTYNLNSKALLLATYYEIDEIDLLESHIDTFDTFLKRRKDFGDDRIKIYRRLIRFTKKLARIIPGDKVALAKLKEEIENTKGVVNANWLLEKIKALE